MKICLNCNEKISAAIKYCHACGQKTEFLPLNFYNIIKDFISKFFNVENKLWTTLKDIWVPAKLPLAYIEGKRKPYYHPIRLFLFILFGFFALLLFNMGESLESVEKFSDANQRNIWEEKLLMKYGSLAKDYPLLIDTTVGLRHKIFQSTLEFDEMIESNNGNELDSIIAARAISNPMTIKDLVDSLETENPSAEFTVENGTDGHIDFTLTGSLKASDLFRLTPEELTEKHGGDSRYNSFFLLQVQKILIDLRFSLAFIIGNGTWAILLSVLSMALLFKLLYLRKNYTYDCMQRLSTKERYAVITYCCL